MPQNQDPADSSRSALLNGQKILFVSGKGGVGKSLVAAALARREALKGRRVLLVEIGDTSYFKDFLGIDKVSYNPVRIKEHGFDLVLWNGETCLREYVLHYLKLERLYHVFFENKVMRALINVAPGLNEIAILGKITSGLRQIGPPLDYDLIVVDCFATGHALALFAAPRGLMQAIQFGPMGSNSRDIERILKDPLLSAYCVVTLAEEMPMIETLEFRGELRRILGVDCQVVVNKIMRPPVAKSDFEAIAEQERSGLGEFATYMLTLQAHQRKLVDGLSDSGCAVAEVPLFLTNEADDLVQFTEEALRTV